MSSFSMVNFYADPPLTLTKKPQPFNIQTSHKNPLKSIMILELWGEVEFPISCTRQDSHSNL